MVKFALNFYPLAGSGKNDPAIKATNRYALSVVLHMELASRDDKATLNSLIDMSIDLDHMLRNQGGRAQETPVLLGTS